MIIRLKLKLTERQISLLLLKILRISSYNSNAKWNFFRSLTILCLSTVCPNDFQTNIFKYLKVKLGFYTQTDGYVLACACSPKNRLIIFVYLNPYIYSTYTISKYLKIKQVWPNPSYDIVNSKNWNQIGVNIICYLSYIMFVS